MKLTLTIRAYKGLVIYNYIIHAMTVILSASEVGTDCDNNNDFLKFTK